MIWLRSLLLLLFQIVVTPFFCIAMLLAAPFGHYPVYALTKGWTGTIVFLARTLCGIDHRIVGKEHIPNTPTIVLSKHQSAWETFFFLQLFPQQVWLLKRELLRIPFFGWGLALLQPIAIDRAAKLAALKQLVEQGRERLGRGLWVVVFPEGTRTVPGETLPYARGGAFLATQTGTPVLPVALNSGRCWQKDTLLRRPGTITVSIGPPIESSGLTPEQLNQKARDWIETEMRQLSAVAV
jgi:1-acyl-sn-glycerol-3-phosphate acyltransferase